MRQTHKQTLNQLQVMPVTNKTAVELIKLHEGLELTVYKCTAGKNTIGYGRNLDDKGITEAEAEVMLVNDMAEHETWLQNEFAFWGELNEARQAVLIDMTHNLGRTGLLGFKNFIAALAVADYSKASVEMLDSRWARQVGMRAHRLSNIMATGENRV